jgi:branched-chain amino acid aminotransferase
MEASMAPDQDRKRKQAALHALQEVSRKARIFVSMPAVEGITPRPLLEAAGAETFDAGEFVPRRHGVFRLDEIGLSCLDHVGLYGDGVFEGILIPDGRIFLMKEHIDRLWRSASRISLAVPYRPLELTMKMLETAREVALEPGDRGYIRLVVTRGIGDLGINPAKCIGATVFALVSTIRIYPREVYETGIRLGVSRYVRQPDATIIDPTVKSNNYLNNVLALVEGTQDGEYLEAMILTRDGFVAEATVDNLFLVRRRPGWESDPSRVVVETPRPEYCLNGITRALVLRFAREMGYRVDEHADLLPMNLIGDHREVFMTGTGAGVMPIVGITNHPVGDGRPGPITRRFIERVDRAMQSPEFGLPLDASESEARDYLLSPGLLSVPEAQAQPV